MLTSSAIQYAPANSNHAAATLASCLPINGARHTLLLILQLPASASATHSDATVQNNPDYIMRPTSKWFSCSQSTAI